MEKNKTSPLLRYAARRAAQNIFFLAGYLTEFSTARGIGEDELARFLGCDPGLLLKLALCRRPDPESPGFRSDVERIAAAFEIQPGHLAQIIREVDMVKALAKAKTMKQGSPYGLLATARDDEKTPQNGDTEESSESEGGKT